MYIYRQTGVLCDDRMGFQKERYIQISKVDDEERKRRERQKQEREQVTFLLPFFLYKKS